MGVIGIGVGAATMGRICRDKDGNITEQSTARWDADPAGGSVAIWPMDPEKMEPSGPAEVYGDWDAAAYLRRVVELIHPNRRINIPDLEAMIRAAAKAREDICTYCPDCNCRDCIVNEWRIQTINDQVILSVTKRNGGLEVTTSGTGNDKLAAMCGYKERGRVIDKLVREKMIMLGGRRNENMR